MRLPFGAFPVARLPNTKGALVTPRIRLVVTNYLRHVSGQARVVTAGQTRVSFAGQDFYLGKDGTPESLARYHSLLAQYAKTGERPNQPTRMVEEKIRVRDLVADYRARVLPRYRGKPAAPRNRIKHLLDMLDDMYGSDAASTFGPRKLDAMQNKF